MPISITTPSQATQRVRGVATGTRICCAVPPRPKCAAQARQCRARSRRVTDRQLILAMSGVSNAASRLSAKNAIRRQSMLMWSLREPENDHSSQRWPLSHSISLRPSASVPRARPVVDPRGPTRWWGYWDVMRPAGLVPPAASLGGGDAGSWNSPCGKRRNCRLIARRRDVPGTDVAMPRCVWQASCSSSVWPEEAEAVPTQSDGRHRLDGGAGR